jgi:hypothetical protein
MYNGEGCYKWLDGGCYTGTMRNDLQHGYGSLIEPDGTEYYGKFYEDSYHGEGRLIEDGRIYEGTFKKGKKNGTFQVTSLKTNTKKQIIYSNDIEKN